MEKRVIPSGPKGVALPFTDNIFSISIEIRNRMKEAFFRNILKVRFIMIQ